MPTVVFQSLEPTKTIKYSFHQFCHFHTENHPKAVRKIRLKGRPSTDFKNQDVTLINFFHKDGGTNWPLVFSDVSSTIFFISQNNMRQNFIVFFDSRGLDLKNINIIGSILQHFVFRRPVLSLKIEQFTAILFWEIENIPLGAVEKTRGRSLHSSLWKKFMSLTIFRTAFE